MNPLLHARISVDYPNKPGALRDIEFEIGEGEIFGLVGESGSGKSTIALAMLRLLEHKNASVQGEILFEGSDLLRLKPAKCARFAEIADRPGATERFASSLNPALRIGTQMAEAWKAHHPGDRQAWERQSLEIFQQVSLQADKSFLRRYPRELSVGQAQRVLIAMSVLHHPRLLIADEPTSALDAITQSEVLALLRQLRQDFDMAILFISHDLASVASLCDRVAILRSGEIVESGSREQIFSASLHEYTRALLRAIPRQPVLHGLDAFAYSVSSTSRSIDMR